jgi:hypothetical protein
LRIVDDRTNASLAWTGYPAVGFVQVWPSNDLTPTTHVKKYSWKVDPGDTALPLIA